MRLGAQFLCQDFDEYIASVQKAEEAGYEFAWLIDSQILWQDVAVYMINGLNATERITFGTAVTNPVTRHVTVTASYFATLGKLHPGRVTLGIGRRRQLVADDGRAAGPDQGARGLRALAPGADGRADGRPRWHRRAPALPRRRGCGRPDHDVGHRPEEPAARRYARRSGDAVRGRHPRGGAVGARAMSARARSQSVATRRRSRSRSCARCDVSDDKQAAADACRWAPAACANHIADMARNNPDNDMPDVMLRLVKAREDYDYYAGHLGLRC